MDYESEMLPVNVNELVSKKCLHHCGSNSYKCYVCTCSFWYARGFYARTSRILSECWF